MDFRIRFRLQILDLDNLLNGEVFRVPENVFNDVHSNAMKVWTSGHILFSSSRRREVTCVDLSSREIWLGGQVMKCKIEELLKSKPLCSLVISVTPLR